MDRRILPSSAGLLFLDQRQYSATPIDGLTKLYNRRHLMETIESELGRAQRPARPLTLARFDLDHFKRLNDAHGHLAGDHVLREIASIARRHTRPGDTFARYGGEEFAWLLPETNVQSAAVLAEGIRADMATHTILFEERALSITLSAGVAQADESTRSASDLIRSADLKLYQAKREGRDRVAI